LKEDFEELEELIGKEVKILMVSEEVASKFFDNGQFTFRAKCPYCGKVAEIEQCGSGAAFNVPDELMEKVGYPSVGRCSNCRKLLVVGCKL